MARTKEQRDAEAAADLAIRKTRRPDGIHMGLGRTPGSNLPTPDDYARRQAQHEAFIAAEAAEKAGK